MRVIKFISKGGMTYEVGDFYGGDGEDDVIRFMVMEGWTLKINTNHTHDISIQDGDWAKFDDGTDMLFEEDEDDSAT